MYTNRNNRYIKDVVYETLSVGFVVPEYHKKPHIFAVPQNKILISSVPVCTIFLDSVNLSKMGQYVLGPSNTGIVGSEVASVNSSYS